MNISPITSAYQTKSVKFGHDKSGDPIVNASMKDRLKILGAASAGVAIACAGLAKNAGYSLKPAKMFRNIKNSYLAKTDFKAKQVITIGAGSCLGGLVGGYMLDNDAKNRKAKTREAVMQMGNISIPILTVKYLAEWTEKYGKFANTTASIGAVFLGVFIANILMNKLGDYLFNNKKETRGIKITDFSAHLDDFVLAATYIFPKSGFVHNVGRAIPVALMIPGMEVGLKKSKEIE